MSLMHTILSNSRSNAYQIENAYIARLIASPLKSLNSNMTNGVVNPFKTDDVKDAAKAAGASVATQIQEIDTYNGHALNTIDTSPADNTRLGLHLLA